MVIKTLGFKSNAFIIKTIKISIKIFTLYFKLN
jgi:hypothetical protein